MAASQTARIVFAFGGEGTTDVTTDLALVQTSPSWAKCVAALSAAGVPDAAAFVAKALGAHAAPASPLATTVVNICLCDIWKAWGYAPAVAVGHSMGELAAAYAAGLYTLEQTLAVAAQLGAAAATAEGRMLHTRVSASELAALRAAPAAGLALAAVNDAGAADFGVSLCGTAAAVAARLASDKAAKPLKPEHAWHSAALYSAAAQQLFSAAPCPATAPAKCGFASAVTGTGATAAKLGADHWQAWLVKPVDFVAALRAAKAVIGAGPVVSVELSAHPALGASVQAELASKTHASSMCRGTNSIAFALEQRRRVETALGAAGPLRAALARLSVDGKGLGFAENFGALGFKSSLYPALAQALDPFFPGVKAHDLYRFQSVEELCARYGTDSVSASQSFAGGDAASFGVVGVAVALAGGVDTAATLWRALAGGDGTAYDAYADQNLDLAAIRKEALPHFASVAEAEAADDHQALALALAHRALKDAPGGAAAVLGAALGDDEKKARFGVYLGAWQRADGAGKSGVSAYGALGEALGALPGRVAASLDARGPALLVDTACSSALVALDMAMADLRRGRVDWALVGGVNVVAGGAETRLDAQLRKGRFLSPTRRCHTFSAMADGYARRGGGAMLLLRRVADGDAGSGALAVRAHVVGTATSQNRRQQPISAVDGDAQERCIRAALADARAVAKSVAAVECHGTGTPLGDPVEVAALARVYGAAGAAAKPVLASAKARFGHLEAGAGAVGLVAAALYAHRGRVVRRAVDGGRLNGDAVDAAKGSLNLPDERAATNVTIADGALVGVSSFGFAGSNAHALIARVAPALSSPLDDDEAMFFEPLREDVVVVKVAPPAPPAAKKAPVTAAAPADVTAAVWAACARVGASSPTNDVDADIFSLGVDSLGLAEVVGALEGVYGDAIVGVDEVMNEPTVRAIAAMITKALGGKAAAAPADFTAAVWAACARVGASSPTNDVDADIFSLGVDSLGLAEVVGALENQFGEGVVGVDEVMNEPTVRAIAAMLAKSKSAPAKAAPVAAAKAVSASAKTAGVLRADEVSSSVPVWFAVTHVGSLPRASADTPVAEVLAAQLACGVDIVNDGEWSRPNYVAELLGRIDGLGSINGEPVCSDLCCCEMPLAADMAEVPLHASRFSGGNGLISLNPKRMASANVACVARPTYRQSGANGEFVDAFVPFRAAVLASGRRIEDCFWSVPSPGTLSLFCEDRFFSPGGWAKAGFNAAAHKEYVNALALAMAAEFRLVAAQGLWLQIDCPDLAMGRHTRWASLTDDEFVRDVVEVNIAALNIALEGIDPNHIRFHICWGNYSGPHHLDMPGVKIWKAVQKVNASVVLLEGANCRHEHEWEALLKVCPLGEGKVLAPGLIDTKCATVEHPELIARRLLRYAEQLGAWRVLASTDCGFASTAKSAAVTADVAWLKLAALGEGAKIARRQVANANAPMAMRITTLAPVGFRVALVSAQVDAAQLRALTDAAWPWPVVVCADAQACIKAHASALDWPLAIVGAGAEAAAVALRGDRSVARRAINCFAAEAGEAAPALAQRVRAAMTAPQKWDKLQLAPKKSPSRAVPTDVDVVVVGAGLCGLVAALKAKEAGLTYVVLEQRSLVGGVWSSLANSSSQVNSSEGGYNLRSLFSEKDPASTNRDHSPSSEICADIEKLAHVVGHDHIFCGASVAQILKSPSTSGGPDGHAVVATFDGAARVVRARGVVVACNDRVGAPRDATYPGQDSFVAAGGTVARGLSDDLAGFDFRGKHVVVVGFGAFAVENCRTALEHGAAKVTVLARRHGTVCPKIIDYLNFVKPFDENFHHDTATNVKQMRAWQKLYAKSGATLPECWPQRIKHDGHTISVSDVWWVAHHMGKLGTTLGEIADLSPGKVNLKDGSSIACDVVIACIGFHRNTTVCERVTGKSEVLETNYLAPNLMYLADAEIDDGAFNSFFGSSVLEYAKFYAGVFAFGLTNADAADDLWGAAIARYPIHDRKWSHYIAASRRLVAKHAHVAGLANKQVADRTEHLWGSYPPASYVAANKQEWVELHTRLNGGVAVPEADQLPYFFDEAAAWCGTNPVAKE